MRIYTRTGDEGDTGLFGGQRVRKSDLRIEAIGDVDELNCSLGVVRALKPDADLELLLSQAQNDLFVIGADLATPQGDEETRGRATINRLSNDRALRLEAEIDRLDTEIRPLTQFILPAGSELAANLHSARSVCRRAERRCVELAAAEKINQDIVRYLNRFSDLLFTMARAANARAGISDVPWTQQGPSR